jgi:hypothetical protein
LLSDLSREFLNDFHSFSSITAAILNEGIILPTKILLLRYWNSEKFKVTSVNFMGAAVDDEVVSKDLSYILKNPAVVKNMSE